MPENASIVLYTFTFRKAGSPLSYTGEGAREVLGTSSITEGLRSDDSLIPDPVRDLPRTAILQSQKAIGLETSIESL